MRYVTVLGLAVALLGPMGCGEDAPVAPEVVRPVKILEIGAGAAAGRREYPGTVKASQRAELSFEVAGKLLEFPVDEGDDVEPGTVLARLDDRDYRTRLDKAQANLNNGIADFRRAQKLFKEGVLAEAALDNRRRSYQVFEADVREAKKAVEDAVLEAPFAGTVAKKLVEDFEQIQAKQSVLIFENAGSLEIEVDVPERDLLQGPAAERSREQATRELDPRVTITANPDREYAARVSEFSPTADPTTRTFRATLAFDPPEDIRVLPGMTAKVSIRLPAADGSAGGPSVPARAVVADEDGGSFVWVVDRQAMTTSRRSVAVGELSGDRIGVRSGLEDGDLVAVSGVHQLREGMKVSRIAD